MTPDRDFIEAQSPNKAFFEAQQFEVKRWLQGKKEGTRHTYTSAIKAYVEYKKCTPKELIDQAEEDRKKSSRYRGQPEFDVKAFFDWLITDYPQKVRGRGKRKKVDKKGVSPNIAYTYANAIRGFYSANGFPLDIEIQKTPPKKENFKLALRPPDIKRLLDATTNLRDKAIILTLFQSGMSINECCNLTYADIAKGLETNEEPLNLHLIRKKEQVEYDTFIGAEAIEAIKAYLDQRRRKGEVLERITPVFILEFTTNLNSTKTKSIYAQLVEDSIRKAALKAGLVTQEQLALADMSPCRPHALRTAFMSILKMAGMNNTLVEYFSGHTISPTEKAYLRLTTDELKKTYKQYEKFLSISNNIDTQKIEELETKTKTFETETKNNQSIIKALMQNSDYKDIQINGLNTQISNTNGQLTSLTSLLTQVQDTLSKLNEDMDFHRLEDIARFVAAKAPTRQELYDFMTKRQIPQTILRRIELQCIAFSIESNRWIYQHEEDKANLIMA
jgi:integrase